MSTNILDLLKSNYTEIVLALGGIASFFAGRKTKKNADVNAELENIDKVRQIEKRLLLDMEEQITKLMSTTDRLEQIVDRQSVKIRAYEIKYGKL